MGGDATQKSSNVSPLLSGLIGKTHTSSYLHQVALSVQSRFQSPTRLSISRLSSKSTRPNTSSVSEAWPKKHSEPKVSLDSIEATPLSSYSPCQKTQSDSEPSNLRRRTCSPRKASPTLSCAVSLPVPLKLFVSSRPRKHLRRS